MGETRKTFFVTLSEEEAKPVIAARAVRETDSGAIRFLLQVLNGAFTRGILRWDLDRWDWYEEKDRLYIPVGGGSQRFLVRKDAKPKAEFVLAWYRREIDNEKGKADFALRNAARLTEEMKKWEAQS